MTTTHPYFIITIDTEGDNLWERKTSRITTENARFLLRFQRLCESYGLKPTYLTNYEMAKCPGFVEFGRDVIKRGTGEIGMHLHAWNSPPIVSLTGNDYFYQPYLVEYPSKIIREKIKFITNLLEDTFRVKMLSHRAGRWSFNSEYASCLVDEKYLVDCSVTPYVSWSMTPGDPGQDGGVDFRKYPDYAYFVDLSNIRFPGNSKLLEVPMTIIPKRLRELLRHVPASMQRNRYMEHALRRLAPVHWLRPNGRNLHGLLWILKRAQEERKDYVEFTLHSSELMPGGSPTFRTKGAIESLYEDLDALFKATVGCFAGVTLSEYAQKYYQKFRPGI